MRVTPAMRDLERQHGKPIRELLMDSYNELGTISRVGDRLGIDTSTVSHWMVRLGIEIRARKEALSA